MNPINSFSNSSLISRHIIEVGGIGSSVVIRAAGKGPSETFGEKRYIPGDDISFEYAPHPTVRTGTEIAGYNEITERLGGMTALPKRWQKYISYNIKQNERLFDLPVEKLRKFVIMPSIKALKEKMELEAMQYLKEHSPLLPNFAIPADQPLTPVNSFTMEALNGMNKLFEDLCFPQYGRTLILNTRDKSKVSSSLQTSYMEKMAEELTRQGGVPSKLDGFVNTVSPYMNMHLSKLDAGQARGPLRFTALPTSDKDPRATLKNMSAEDITLTSADILYHVADTPTTGIKLMQQPGGNPIEDSRISFCITSDKYIEPLTEAQMDVLCANNYKDVEYTIPAGGELDISISSMFLWDETKGHKNVSREIVIGDTGDQFWVMDDHYKNICTAANFLFYHVFKMPDPDAHYTDSSRALDPKTNTDILIIKDYDIVRSRNILLFQAMSVLGAVPQMLVTLPSAITLTEDVALIGSI